MQLNALRYFIKLAEAESFYAAAKEVYLSQQGLNKSITALEAEIGAKLLIRSNRGVRLTPAGIEVLNWSRTILNDYDQMLDAVLQVENEAGNGESSRRACLSYFVMQLMDSIRAAGVGTALSLNEMPADALHEALRAGDTTDLYVCELFVASKRKLLEEGYAMALPLVSSTVGIAVNMNNPLSRHEKVSLADFEGMPCALNSHSEIVEGVREVLGGVLPSNIQVRTTNPRLIFQFAQSNNDAYCITDSFSFYLAQNDPDTSMDNLVFLPLATPRAHFEICVLKNRSVQHPDLQIRSAKRIRDVLGKTYPSYYEQYPLEVV